MTPDNSMQYGNMIILVRGGSSLESFMRGEFRFESAKMVDNNKGDQMCDP